MCNSSQVFPPPAALEQRLLILSRKFSRKLTENLREKNIR